MKKLWLYIVVVLFFSSGILIYNLGIAKTFRYITPEESFIKCSDRGTKLVDILEDKDIALIIYEKKNGTYSDSIIAKDVNGWTPLSTNYKNKKEIPLESGFIYLKEICGKNTVQIVIVLEENKDAPNMSDSLDSEFISSSYDLNSGRKILYGFLVLEEGLPSDYWIGLGGEKFTLNNIT